MSLLVTLRLGEFAVAAPLSVVVPLLTVFEEDDVVLDTVLEITVGSVARALTESAKRLPMRRPIINHQI